jgi:hypothetical protein
MADPDIKQESRIRYADDLEIERAPRAGTRAHTRSRSRDSSRSSLTRARTTIVPNIALPIQYRTMLVESNDAFNSKAVLI